MFSENYSVCLNDDGSPREIARSGPIVTYKAIGYDSGRVVAMQLIPLASIDEVERVRFEENARMAQKLDNTNLARVFDVGIEHDHLAFVSEYLEGDTAAAWVPSLGAVPRFVRNLVSGMVRTNPEERPQNPAAFAEKVHACLRKAERQTAFTRSFGPAASPTISTRAREKKRIAPALTLAAVIAVLASLGAFYFVRSQRESKPLGVIIGVPETAEAPSLPVTASASPSPVIKLPAGQPGLVAQQSPTQAASPASTADNVSSSPQVAANNRMAEPPVPAEGPSETSQAPVGSASESPPPEKNESAPPDLPNRTELAAKDSLATTTSGNEPPDSSGHVATTAGKRNDSNASKTKARRQRLAKSYVRGPLPPLRVGAEYARFVGTTSNGKWLLRLPSGETIVTPPVPNIDYAPVISHRRVRRVARPIPLEDEPPVVVVPPDL